MLQELDLQTFSQIMTHIRWRIMRHKGLYNFQFSPEEWHKTTARAIHDSSIMKWQIDFITIQYEYR